MLADHDTYAASSNLKTVKHGRYHQVADSADATLSDLSTNQSRDDVGLSDDGLVYYECHPQAIELSVDSHTCYERGSLSQSIEEMKKTLVAVVGAGKILLHTIDSILNIRIGPTGLSMLKTLRGDGFQVTLFERRKNVGGLWAFSEDPSYTTALPRGQ